MKNNFMRIHLNCSENGPNIIFYNYLFNVLELWTPPIIVLVV